VNGEGNDLYAQEPLVQQEINTAEDLSEAIFVQGLPTEMRISPTRLQITEQV
jgi:hypothetical protein